MIRVFASKMIGNCRALRKSLGLACCLAASSLSANEANRVDLFPDETPERVIHVIRSDHSERRIKGLLLKPVIEASSVNAVLEGEFAQPGWVIASSEAVLSQPMGAAGGIRFRLPVHLKGSATSLMIIAIGPLGEVMSEPILLKTSPGRTENAATAQWIPASEPLWRFGVGAGYSWVNYEETGIRPLSKTALTARGSATRTLSKHWELGLGGYFTVAELSSNVSGKSVRFMGLNARVGYRSDWMPDPWRLKLMGGLYYASMLVSTTPRFGYSNIVAPQVFPVIEYRLNPRNTLSAYGKYALLNGTSLGDREAAAGVSWNRNTSKKYMLSMGLNYANLTTAVGRSRISSSTRGLELGMSW